MTRLRVTVLLALGVGLASVFPSGLLGDSLRQTISRHDDWAHGGAYAILSFCTCWTVWPLYCEEPDWRPGYVRPAVAWRWLRALLVVALVVGSMWTLGAAVELIQEWADTNRSLSKDDMIANGVGAAAGAGLWLVARFFKYVISGPAA